MRKIREILRMKHEQGLPQRSIAGSLHVAIGTVSEYLAKAKEMALSWPLPEEMGDAELEAQLFPAPKERGGRSMPDFAYIHEELIRTEVTLLRLWVEYATDHPGGYRYSRFCELYSRWRKKLNSTMRQRHRAGEKTFVDFSGKKPHLVDPGTGEIVEVELFVGVLGASSYTYAEVTRSQDLESWVGAHQRMVEYFKGSSEIWIPDNLKSGVVHADRYEPGVNRTYEELAAHYGAVVIPARVAKPKDKAKEVSCFFRKHQLPSATGLEPSAGVEPWQLQVDRGASQPLHYRPNGDWQVVFGLCLCGASLPPWFHRVLRPSSAFSP
jgi:transposase